MNYRTIAETIPAEYRAQILNEDMVNTAQPYGGNYAMDFLITIWRNYFEPDLDITCGMCYTRVLANWKNILNDLVELEKENNLLNAV